MKKRFSAALLALLFCLTLAACSAAEPEETTAAGTTLPTTDTGRVIQAQTIPSPGDSIPNGQNRIRIPYTTNRSSVRYVTNPSQLPDYEELSQYDDAYFQDHALVLVYETVTSGSILIDIDSIQYSGSNASVVLTHVLQGDVGTSDMATWLLWAEVEPDLSYSWTVANPALKDSSETH